MKLAIVYDWLDKWGGVERVLLALHEMFPNAAFYTSYFDKDRAAWAQKLLIHQSFIHTLPFWVKHRRILSLPFYPFAFEAFDFSEYDVVISVTSSFAKSIITKPGTAHLCYMLTPTRFLWSHQQTYLGNRFIREVSAPYINRLKSWDYIAAQRPDKIISISETVADRVEQYYDRKSRVLYPPFDTDYWHDIAASLSPKKSNKGQKYFLIVSRLEKYKRIELVVQTINALPHQKLIIVGSGSEEENLRAVAKPNVTFLKNISDKELARLYMNAEALIMPQEEDFGFVSLEAQYFGCPVISLSRGGAVETIVNNKTGIFFEEQTVESLCEALERFHTISYNLKSTTEKEGKKHTAKFSRNIFEKEFNSILKRYTL